jgi:hypothetical protein
LHRLSCQNTSTYGAKTKGNEKTKGMKRVGSTVFTVTVLRSAKYLKMHEAANHTLLNFNIKNEFVKILNPSADSYTVEGSQLYCKIVKTSFYSSS